MSGLGRGDDGAAAGGAAGDAQEPVDASRQPPDVRTHRDARGHRGVREIRTRAGSAVSRLLAAREPSGRTRQVLAALGAIGVLIALVVSVRALEVSPTSLRWGPLALVVLVLTPATMLANAAELQAMAAGTATRRLRWSEAIEVVVLATAANLLPVPGAALVRLQALRTRGATLRASALINLAGAGLWLGTGLIVAGALLGGVGGLSAVAVGFAAGAAGIVLVARAARPGRFVSTTVLLAAAELSVTVLHGLRLLTVLVALGVDLELTQALVIGVSAPLSAAAGVFPAGIGIAEALSGLLAPLVALPVAAGVAATGLNRIIGLAVTAPVAFVLAARRRSSESTAGEAGLA